MNMNYILLQHICCSTFVGTGALVSAGTITLQSCKPEIVILECDDVMWSLHNDYFPYNRLLCAVWIDSRHIDSIGIEILCFKYYFQYQYLRSLFDYLVVLRVRTLFPVLK